MLHTFDPGALLSHVYRLPGGGRVRLRLVHRRDEPAIRVLLAERGAPPQDIELRRLARFDPRRRVVICATALVGASEALVGLGAIELEQTSDPQPDLLIVGDHAPAQLGELLVAALRGRAYAIARSRAA